MSIMECSQPLSIEYTGDTEFRNPVGPVAEESLTHVGT